MKNIIIFILFSVSSITIALLNSDDEGNHLNYQARNLFWCKKFCTAHTNHYHDNKVSHLIKLKCKVCQKHYHSTTSLAPNLMVQTSAATAAASTITTTTTLATTKAIIIINDNTKSTIQQTTVTSTTPIASTSTTLPTTTTTKKATTTTTTRTTTAATTSATTSAATSTTTTTIATVLKDNIQSYLNKAKKALDYIMDITMSVERIKERVIKQKDDMVELEMKMQIAESLSLADFKYEGGALKDNIINQSDEAEKAKKYVSDSKIIAIHHLESAKKEAAKTNLDISAEIQMKMDNLDKLLKKFDNEYKMTKNAEMKAIAIYDKY